MKNEKTADDALLRARVRKTVAARLLGVEKSTVSNLVTKGVLRPEPDATFVLPDLIQSYVQSVKDDRRLGVTERDVKLKELRIAERELALSVKRGELRNAAAMDAYFGERAGRLFGMLDGLPARCTRDLALRRIIQAGVDEIRNAFAAECEREAERIKAGDK